MSSLDVAPEPAAAPPRTGVAALVGLGVATGGGVAANEPVATAAGVTPQWIERRTGIRERREALPGETTTVLATDAGRAALEDAGVDAAELDLVVVATMTPDRACPQVAPLVAGALGAVHAGAFDVGAACNGWLSALVTVAALQETGRSTAALVIGADRIRTAVVDPADKGTAPLFGDGAGAAVVVAGGDGPRVGHAVLHSDGTGGELIASDLTGPLRMDGHETFQRAIKAMTGAAAEVCERAGIGLDDVDLVVPHQANARITAAVAERLGLPPERIVDAIALVGNTSAGTLPIALAGARVAGRLPADGRVLLAAFGSGLAWGACLLEIGDPA